MKPITHKQEGFFGGLNTLLDSSQLEPNEYRLLVNARARFGRITPIKKPLLVESGLPAGNFQGCYSAGNFGIVFVSGKAYYKDYSLEGSAFAEVNGDLQLSDSAETIYAQAVPASTVNYVRKAGSTADAEITFGDTLTGSPQAFVVQDGVNQPWVIFSDGSARVTRSWNEWSSENREYVPVGTLMAYVNGILFIVSGRQIYRSVSGRPLDFVIAIDNAGEKISADEDEGGAIRGVFYIGFDDITAMLPNGSDNGGLVVSTRRTTHFVLPRYDLRKIYGEPTFDIVPLFSTGAINQFSSVDILGDVAFVDLAGIRTFNAVNQLKNSGQNAPFSLRIASLFEGTEQDVVAVGSFDNYDFFAVTTVHGAAVLVYDELSQKFVAIDFYEDVAQIKQFALIKTDLQRKLIFITVDNKFYEAFGSADVEEAGFFFGERATGQARQTQDPLYLKLLFTDVLEQGFVETTVYVDEKAGVTRQEELVQDTVVRATPRPLPFDNADDIVKPMFFNLKDEGLLGHRVGCWIRWQFDASLLLIEMAANVHDGRQDFKESAVRFNTPIIDATLSETSGVAGDFFYITGSGLSAVTGIIFGGAVSASFQVLDDSTLKVFVPAGAESDSLTLEFGDRNFKTTQSFSVE